MLAVTPVSNIVVPYFQQEGHEGWKPELDDPVSRIQSSTWNGEQQVEDARHNDISTEGV